MSVYTKRLNNYDGRIIIEKAWRISKKYYNGRNHGLPYQINYADNGTSLEIFYVNRGFFKGKMCQQIQYDVRFGQWGGVMEKYKGNLYELQDFNGEIQHGSMLEEEV